MTNRFNIHVHSRLNRKKNNTRINIKLLKTQRDRISERILVVPTYVIRDTGYNKNIFHYSMLKYIVFFLGFFFFL